MTDLFGGTAARTNGIFTPGFGGNPASAGNTYFSGMTSAGSVPDEFLERPMNPTASNALGRFGRGFAGMVLPVPGGGRALDWLSQQALEHAYWDPRNGVSPTMRSFQGYRDPSQYEMPLSAMDQLAARRAAMGLPGSGAAGIFGDITADLGGDAFDWKWGGGYDPLRALYAI